MSQQIEALTVNVPKLDLTPSEALVKMCAAIESQKLDILSHLQYIQMSRIIQTALTQHQGESHGTQSE